MAGAPGACHWQALVARLPTLNMLALRVSREFRLPDGQTPLTLSLSRDRRAALFLSRQRFGSSVEHGKFTRHLGHKSKTVAKTGSVVHFL